MTAIVGAMNKIQKCICEIKEKISEVISTMPTLLWQHSGANTIRPIDSSRGIAVGASIDVIDASNVFIGQSSSPYIRLEHSTGSIQNYLTIQKNTGNSTNILNRNNSGNSYIYLDATTNGSTNSFIELFANSFSQAGASFRILNKTSTAEHNLRAWHNVATANWLCATSGMLLGIGTTSPSEKLDIDGKIRVRGLNLQTSYAYVVVCNNNGVFGLRNISDFGL